MLTYVPCTHLALSILHLEFAHEDKQKLLPHEKWVSAANPTVLVCLQVLSSE